MKNVFYYNSLIGNLEIIVEFDSLVSLKIVENNNKINPSSEFEIEIKNQLDEYFSYKRRNFDIKINPKGSEFQKRVWLEAQNILYSQTSTYQEIASKIGNKNSQRAVGSALNKNPILIIIPCHRIISKNGKLSGFAYGTNIKEKLLKLEKAR